MLNKKIAFFVLTHVLMLFSEQTYSQATSSCSKFYSLVGQKKSAQTEEQLISLGYSPSVARRLSQIDLPWINQESTSITAYPVRRGFQGDWRNYDPSYGIKVTNDAEIWVSPGLTPFGYANGAETNQRPEMYYVLEYEIPKQLLFTQYGAFGNPTNRPPNELEWGYFKRSAITNERAYIRKIYFPRNVELEPGYPVHPMGWYEFNFEDVFSDSGVYLGPQGKPPRNIRGAVLRAAKI